MGILLGYKKLIPTYLPYFSVARYANTTILGGALAAPQKPQKVIFAK